MAFLYFESAEHYEVKSTRNFKAALVWGLC